MHDLPKYLAPVTFLQYDCSLKNRQYTNEQTFFLHTFKDIETGIYYADATPLEVCHIKREKRHKVFKSFAKKGKSSMGWFFGLKLHIIINQLGELMGVSLTPGNTNDRSPVLTIIKNLQGWLFADKGYIGKDFLEKLKQKGVDLFTRTRKNMK